MVGTILSIFNEISKIQIGTHTPLNEISKIKISEIHLEKISEIHLEISVQSMFKIVSLLNEIYKTYQTHLYLMYTS